MTQKKAILQHLLKGKSITQREAIAFFNCIRLSAVIYDLKKEGYEFEIKDKKNLMGKGKYRKYKLKMKKVDIIFT